VDRALYSRPMWVRVFAAVLAIVMGTACSPPPDKERHQAEGALAAARAAGAADYAADSLALAEQALAKYEPAVSARDYREALRVAIEARDRAYEAARTAADEKALARGRAERLLSQVEIQLAELTARLAPGAPGMSAPGTDERAMLDHAQARLQEARSKLAAQDYQTVTASLTSLTEQIRAASAALPRARR
jgi:hypothetical protein